MTKSIALALGILMASLALAGVAQAQDAATIQGTIQAVDCTMKTLEVKAADGSNYKVYVVPASTAVFVNAQPVNFCTLQQYVGSTATVTLVPNGGQLMVRRVDVSAAASPASTQGQPSGTLVKGMPDWAKIALGAVLIGGIVYYFTSRPRAPQAQPYHLCPDGYYRPSC